MSKSTPSSGLGRPPSIKDPAAAICNAAAKLIAQNGYDGTSLQDVAKVVGMTKAGLYHYFPTKQAIFDAITLTTLKDMQKDVEAALSSQARASDKLEAFMIAHASYFDSHRDNYGASFFGRAGGGDGDYTPAQLALRKAYVKSLEDILRVGVADGSFNIPDIGNFARGILGMLNWMSRWHRADGEQSAASIAQGYAQTILTGISTK